MEPQQWAEEQFGQVHLGDARRTPRAVKVAAALTAHPEQSLPQAMPRWADLKAAYRLLACPKTTHAALIQPHCQATRAALEQPGEHILVEDTTEADYSAHRATTGLGQIGNQHGRGMLIHSTLALHLEGWDAQQHPQLRVEGLLGQQVWVRQGAPRKGREKWRARLRRPRESERWGRVLAGAAGPPLGAHWTFVCDAEGDLYELLDGERLPPGCDFVIRLARDKALKDPAWGTLLQLLEQAAPLGGMQVELRARPGQARRQAHLELRSALAELRPPWRPGRQLAPVKLWVVLAREVAAPAGVKPLCWVLLSSLACPTLEGCRQVVGRYCARWQVEEYHKCLKSGCALEQRQLEKASRLKALLGFLAVVAVRLLALKWQERQQPEAAVPADLDTAEVRQVLGRLVGRPEGGWTLHGLLRAVAQLGGFLGRKSDGEPGIRTLWRGWMRLMDLVLGYQLAHANIATPP